MYIHAYNTYYAGAAGTLVYIASIYVTMRDMHVGTATTTTRGPGRAACTTGL